MKTTAASFLSRVKEVNTLDDDEKYLHIATFRDAGKMGDVPFLFAQVVAHDFLPQVPFPPQLRGVSNHPSGFRSTKDSVYAILEHIRIFRQCDEVVWKVLNKSIGAFHVYLVHKPPSQ